MVPGADVIVPPKFKKAQAKVKCYHFYIHHIICWINRQEKFSNHKVIKLYPRFTHLSVTATNVEKLKIYLWRRRWTLCHSIILWDLNSEPKVVAGVLSRQIISAICNLPCILRRGSAKLFHAVIKILPILQRFIFQCVMQPYIFVIAMKSLYKYSYLTLSD